MQLGCRWPVLLLSAVGLLTLLWLEMESLNVTQIMSNSLPPAQRLRTMAASAASQGPARVLLLTYMRAGSTYTAELLTLHPDVNYLFEPLWQFRHSSLVVDSAELQHSVARFLDALFNCDALVMPETASIRFINRVRFDVAKCKERPMLQKLIRIRGDTASRLLRMNPAVKVVHLVRDPRAAAVSRQTLGYNGKPEYYCSEVRQDLSLADELMANSPNRYALVRYEDLVDHTRVLAELTRLYLFMGVPVPHKQIREYIAAHYSGSLTENKYGTKKRPNFDPNHWQHQLNITQVRHAEHVCADVMLRFGYDVYRRGTRPLT